jgi:hypothetical protein
MLHKRAFYLVVFLILSVASRAQINIFLGGNLNGNYSWIRGDEHTFEPGYGGGVSLVYWEHEYWYLKAGLDYTRRSSTVLDYPDLYGIVPEDEYDKINIRFVEQTVGLPLTICFRPFEKGASTLLITGSLNTLVVAGMKLDSEEYGEYKLKGTDVKTRVKTSVGIGVGYQRQLDKNLYLNIIPTYNIDLRGDKAFTTLMLSAEVLFGVY